VRVPTAPLDRDLAAAAELLAAASDVTLLAHVNPDADALGSALALGLALHRRGADVRVSFGAPDDVPASLLSLDTASLLVPAAEVPLVSGLLVACDTGSRGRLGLLVDRLEPTVAAGGAVLVIDHHVSGDRFGTHHLVDETATAVLVLAVLDAMGVELDADIARCLYAGLVTDTSSFRRATPATHRTAARLIEAGVDPSVTARELMDTHPVAWLPFLARVLGRAVFEPDAAGGHGLVHTAVHLSDMEGVRLEEVESVVDIVRTTAEAEVALVLKEIGPDRWAGSLRAVGKVDVRAVAAVVGGGGHRLAAGFTTEGTQSTILDTLRDALRNPVLLVTS
jgi:phosphoesterase RecJ-like protein